MAGGGARRGTLVIHYGTGHRRPAPRARQPRDEPRSCGSQPAHQSLLDRRLSCRPLPCAIIGRTSCFRTDRRRTPMPPTIESGHESGISLSLSDAAVVKGMLARGDRQHDIAAWFGVNGGRIAEIATGVKFGSVAPAPPDELPPRGPYPCGRDTHLALEALAAAQKVLSAAEAVIYAYAKGH